MPNKLTNWIKLPNLSVCTLVLALLGCGGGGGGGSAGESTSVGGVTGSVVYADTERVSGKLERVIKVMNVSNRATIQFVSGDFHVGGASVSLNGVIAYMVEGDDVVTIKTHRLDGQFITSFFYREALTFPLGGAIISPDGTRVAFALSRLNSGTNQRQDAVYVCNVAAPYNCIFYFNLRDPAWLGNGQVVAVTGDDRKRLFAIDLVADTVNQIGGTQSDRVNNPVGTPDGKTILFDIGTPERIAAMDISGPAAGTVRFISRDGTGQYMPRVSPDGKVLAYLERCCASASTGAVGFSGPALRAVPLDVNSVFTGGVTANLVRDAEDAPLSINGQGYGITPLVN